jgi:hypothetical protein
MTDSRNITGRETSASYLPNFNTPFKLSCIFIMDAPNGNEAQSVLQRQNSVSQASASSQTARSQTAQEYVCNSVPARCN